ncbi:hypothetical protein [Acuticoccus sp.]|uniref:hypothetical protein n=1 Tax=Acuticoccus sp. TaxID=1904378 RepID=UPI003B528CAD
MRCLVAILAVLAIGIDRDAAADDIPVQFRYPPLQIADALPGGAHPIGGAANAFV